MDYCETCNRMVKSVEDGDFDVCPYCGEDVIDCMYVEVEFYDGEDE